MRLQRSLLILFSLVVFLFTSCDNDDDDDVEPQPDQEEEEQEHEELSSDIGEDKILSSNVTYTVTNTIEVEGQLTIEPGTELYFEEGASLEIENSGALIAEGTAEEPILFTGTEEVPGWWDGIRFTSSENPLNSIDHSEIEYADESAVRVGAQVYEASTSITNTTIRDVEGHGIYIYRDSELTDFSNNTITSCGQYPVTFNNDPCGAAIIDQDSDLTGNENDVVRINGDAENIEQDITYLDPGVPYRVEDADIDVRGLLTIAEGVTMEFGAGSSIQMTNGGGLSVEGKEDNPVLFTGVESIPGYWTGIHFVSSDRVDNTIAHAVIEYAGSEPDVAGWDSNAGGNITLGRSISSARVTISDSEIRHSSNYGVYIYDGDLGDEQNVEYNNNESGATN